MNSFQYKHINVILTPTDYCNMNCVYCFNSRRTAVDKKVMSDKTLQKVFEITLPYYEEVKFIWHGGEPLSMGKPFYERVLALQNEINISGTTIKNSMQTNLTLLEEDMALFLVQNQIHIGSSYDGTRNEDTRHRSTQILAGHKLLKRCGGRNGFIYVIQSRNIEHLVEDYEWFKSQKINYIMNPYMAQYPYTDDVLFVPAKQYVEKVCTFFDHWMYDSECNISVSYFNEFIDYILFGRKNLCCYSSCLGKYVGVRYDGRIYCCNRDFSDDYCFGNVHDYTDIRQCFDSIGFQELLSAAVRRRATCKETCKVFDFCVGGCNSAASMGGDIEKRNEYVCQILTAIYDYIDMRITPWMAMKQEEIQKNLNSGIAEGLLRYQKAVPS